MYMIHTVKNYEITIDGEEVDGVEPDTVIFIPENSKLEIKNTSKYSSAVMKIQLTVYENIHHN